jgi:hypothetical protein
MESEPEKQKCFNISKQGDLPDLVAASMVFCIAKFTISYLIKLKYKPIGSSWSAIFDLISAATIVILAAYLFYYSRKYLPGNLTDTSIRNDDPGLEFARVLIWQLYLVSNTFL